MDNPTIGLGFGVAILFGLKVLLEGLLKEEN
jgi:hypothetical protein